MIVELSERPASITQVSDSSVVDMHASIKGQLDANMDTYEICNSLLSYDHMRTWSHAKDHSSCTVCMYFRIVVYCASSTRVEEVSLGCQRAVKSRMPAGYTSLDQH